MTVTAQAMHPHAQHRNTAYLLANNLAGAATGVLFWFLFARLAGLSPTEVGIGYTAVAVATLVAVLAKGGLDTALIRHVPTASRPAANRLLGIATLVGVAGAALLCTLLAAASLLDARLPRPSPAGWLLIAAIAALLVVSWLQDAFFVAEGEARLTLRRNLVLSAARIVLPLPVVALGLAYPVATAWGLALGVSILAAGTFARHLPQRGGLEPAPRAFLASSARNVAGGAAEFLPGLLLAPIVLAVQGPAAAAYFGMAWTAASLLFLASGAIGRSALAELARGRDAGPVLRRAALQQLLIVLPAAVVGAVAAPFVLGLFGTGYSSAAPAMALLCASALLVAPGTLYLALARAQERSFALLALPGATVLLLVVLAPTLGARLGATGVALAWILANVPMAAAGLAAVRKATRTEVNHARPVDRAAHVE